MMPFPGNLPAFMTSIPEPLLNVHTVFYILRVIPEIHEIIAIRKVL